MYLSTSNEELPCMKYTGVVIDDKSNVVLKVLFFLNISNFYRRMIYFKIVD